MTAVACPAAGAPLLEFDVVGDPMGEPRHRTALRRGRIHHVRDERADPWKQTVRMAARKAMARAGHPMPLVGLGEPVRVRLTFRLSRPRKHFRTGRCADELRADAPSWHTAKPDGDNLEKAVLDACGDWPKGAKPLLWADDSVVATVERTKKYTTGKPGVFVQIFALERVA